MKRFISHIAALVIGCLVAWGIVQMIHHTTPVASHMQPTAWQITETAIVARIVGQKNRPECAPVEGSVVGYVKHDNVWEEVPFLFKDDETDFDSRPAIYQSFGWWQWEKAGYHPTHVMMRMAHVCGYDAKFIYSDFGPWKIQND